MDPDVRAAQRRMLGYLRNRGVLDGAGLTLWSEHGCGEWKADARELSDDLVTLGVPHFVTDAGRVQPPWRSAARRWEKTWVLWDDLPTLVRWLPSLGKQLAGVRRVDPPEVVLRMSRETGEASFVVSGERIMWAYPSDGE